MGGNCCCGVRQKEEQDSGSPKAKVHASQNEENFSLRNLRLHRAALEQAEFAWDNYSLMASSSQVPNPNADSDASDEEEEECEKKEEETEEEKEEEEENEREVIGLPLTYIQNGEGDCLDDDDEEEQEEENEREVFSLPLIFIQNREGDSLVLDDDEDSCENTYCSLFVCKRLM
eukprot:symbB.v1.2.035904.t1/scaffold4945.1/size32544/1